MAKTKNEPNAAAAAEPVRELALLAEPHVRIFAKGEPGAGGACSSYLVEWNDVATGQRAGDVLLKFQEGAVPEKGVNGLTNEALLAVVIDRLECFQAGPFPCNENNDALAHARRALELLIERTKKRLARGVEGKLER
jgi:hypothetical protein